jgi:hypothetical protein
MKQNRKIENYGFTEKKKTFFFFDSGFYYAAQAGLYL